MRAETTPLTTRLAEIGGHLQKLRWEALDAGFADLARNIAHAIDAVAWAAGINAQDGNVVERPGTPAKALNEESPPSVRRSNAA